MYEVFLNGSLLYSTSRVELQRGLICKGYRFELNKAGTFDFTIHPGHPNYDDFEALKTVITIEDDGEEIFRGRVLHTTTSFYKEKAVTCEGDLAYLNDSLFTPGGEEGYTETVEAFFERCVAAHNSQVESWKQFSVGDVTIEKKFAVETFKPNGYSNVFTVIDNELLKYYGGFLRTRRENGITYLDYLESYEAYSLQPIQFSVNLLDISEDFNSEDIYTVLVPVGKDDLTIASVNGGSRELVNQTLVNKYGRICRAQTFNDIEDPSLLLAAGQNRFARDIIGFAPKYTCKAIDLHLLYPTLDKLLLGYRVQVISPPQAINVDEMILSGEIDIQNPENNKYDIGEYSETLQRRSLSSKEASDASTASQATADSIAADNATNKDVTNVKYDLNRQGDTITDQARKISLIATDEELAEIEAGEISSIYYQSRVELEGTRSAIYTQAEEVADTHRALITAGVFNSVTKDPEGGLIIESSQVARKLEMDTVDGKIDRSNAKLLEAGVFDRIDGDGSIHTHLVARKSVVDANAADIASTKRTLVEAGVYADIDANGNPTAVMKVLEEGKVITAINASREGVTIDAAKVDISGIMSSNIVQATALTVAGLNVTGGAVFEGVTCTGDSSISGTITAGSIVTSSGLDLGTHQHWVTTSNDGTITIGAPTNLSGYSSFNIADTSYYKNHVGVRSIGNGTASLVSNEWGGWDYNIPVTAYGNDNSSIDRTITISANDAVAQGVYNYYNSYGNWDYPRWDNNWQCTRPNSNNTGSELWFTMSQVLPEVVGWTWSWDTNTRLRCTLEICGKRYTDYYDT